MRAWITVIFLAVFASAGAQANSITIGQFQYLGTDPQGVSGFEVILNTTGVTASALMLRDLRLTENGTAENAGAITTPTAILFLGGPGFRLPACPCESLQIQLFFPTTEKVFTLQLAGGQMIRDLVGSDPALNQAAWETLRGIVGLLQTSEAGADSVGQPVNAVDSSSAGGAALSASLRTARSGFVAGDSGLHIH